MLKGKTVVVGVCGGIAAYKVVEVVSRLKKLGAEVRVIMTGNAAEFVTPLTFQSISQNPVTKSMFDDPTKWEVEHISLARKADLIVVAPATANILGKVANGIADDMLSTTIMATKVPVLFVPAMNYAMYENTVVQENISKLLKHGYRILEPDTGLMAAEGEYGKGRLPEPSKIVDEIIGLFSFKKDFKGIRLLVTAGPTREAIDPVRYITNHSSGKMGYAIARAAADRGASVTLVSGPVTVERPENVELIDVVTAEEMYNAVMNNQKKQDVFIMVAAVADYRCSEISDLKIKKKAGKPLVLELIQNPDIAKELGKIKDKRILVGFSAETNDLDINAKSKLAAKNLDMIVANDVTMPHAGFGTDTNIVKLILSDGTVNELPLMSKGQVAGKILDEINKLIELKKKHREEE